jgi:DNA-binding protein H-NS
MTLLRRVVGGERKPEHALIDARVIEQQARLEEWRKLMREDARRADDRLAGRS